MPKLTDTQSILLAHAAQNEAGSFIPLPPSLLSEDAAEGAPKALAQLVKRGLAEERETSDAAAIHRTDCDLRYALHITPAGLKAIGVEDGEDPSSGDQTASAPSRARQTKAAAVLTLLQRQAGATLGELIEATGWLPHTTRAALTGLRKKARAVERSKRGDATCYRIAAVA